jgi:hypothetical protein
LVAVKAMVSPPGWMLFAIQVECVRGPKGRLNCVPDAFAPCLTSIFVDDLGLALS